ncbi:hypothetical protein BGP84_17115 [Pseudomonas putida]|uniref:Uncharacterized protein n=1 Tax=Pseudomonas putida TaxID=303 RepID=A0A2S3X6Z5_PSEPU|nr:hypothetical protein BGP84_17115 [Pseudomonas putida]POG14715.1 hypothetical protein BGP85_00610 [Pseudomonas putida]
MQGDNQAERKPSQTDECESPTHLRMHRDAAVQPAGNEAANQVGQPISEKDHGEGELRQAKLLDE